MVVSAQNHVKMQAVIEVHPEPKMVSQQASNQFLKIDIEGGCMAKGSKLFYFSTIRTEKNRFPTSQIERLMTQIKVVTTKVRTRR